MTNRFGPPKAWRGQTEENLGLFHEYWERLGWYFAALDWSIYARKLSGEIVKNTAYDEDLFNEIWTSELINLNSDVNIVFDNLINDPNKYVNNVQLNIFLQKRLRDIVEIFFQILEKLGLNPEEDYKNEYLYNYDDLSENGEISLGNLTTAVLYLDNLPSEKRDTKQETAYAKSILANLWTYSNPWGKYQAHEIYTKNGYNIDIELFGLGDKILNLELVNPWPFFDKKVVDVDGIKYEVSAADRLLIYRYDETLKQDFLNAFIYPFYIAGDYSYKTGNKIVKDVSRAAKEGYVELSKNAKKAFSRIKDTFEPITNPSNYFEKYLPYLVVPVLLGAVGAVYYAYKSN